MQVDIEAEQIALGHIFHSHDFIEELQRISPAPFQHKKIAHAFKLLTLDYEKGYSLDFDAFCARHSADKFLDVAFVFGAVNSSRGIEEKFYLDKIRENVKVTCLGALASEISKAQKAQSVDWLAIQTAMDVVHSAATHAREEPKTVAPILENWNGKDETYIDAVQRNREACERGEIPMQGPSFGMDDLDRSLRGYVPGQLTVLGARPSMGKSEFLVWLLSHLNRAAVPTLVYSQEMSPEECVQRLMGMEQARHFQLILDGKFSEYHQNASMTDAYNRLRNGTQKLFIRGNQQFTPKTLAQDLKRQQKKHGIEVAFIDHLGLLGADNPRQSKYEQVTEASRVLKILAGELGIAIWCVSQLNREVTKGTNPRPSMANLRDSGAIEQDADNVLLLHRPEYFDKGNKPGLVELIVSKNRNGPTKIISMEYDYKTERYMPMQPVEEVMAKLNIANDKDFDAFKP